MTPDNMQHLMELAEFRKELNMETLRFISLLSDPNTVEILHIKASYDNHRDECKEMFDLIKGMICSMLRQFWLLSEVLEDKAQLAVNTDDMKIGIIQKGMYYSQLTLAMEGLQKVLDEC